ncbi:hypothetical protein SH2C18_06200 [Clostridium sediminicola]|uniref:hypothetical protein n=1 Tax=Clostridium sediminicola TaxID=3114879 RepID=UPI0031F2604A
MKVKVYLKNKKEPEVFESNRVDVLDYIREGIEYKQIRYFKNGFSKSVYIERNAIKTIVKKSK